MPPFQKKLFGAEPASQRVPVRTACSHGAHGHPFLIPLFSSSSLPMRSSPPLIPSLPSLPGNHQLSRPRRCHCNRHVGEAGVRRRRAIDLGVIVWPAPAEDYRMVTDPKGRQTTEVEVRGGSCGEADAGSGGGRSVSSL